MDPITHRSHLSYIDRTREYYAAQGYEKPYAWARHADAPFAPLPKPLSQCKVGVITTAMPWRAPDATGRTDESRALWSGASDPPPARLYTQNLSWHKEATHTDDVDSFLPLNHLHAAARAGRIGGVAARFHGVPTDYSQRRTQEIDAPEILKRLREDAADIALLVPL
ncbi:MAG: hypothetical protein JNM79_01410 [Burkholderiales bacterium]|nr:hypothetical protein [Burkholderiales bacterium]